MTNRPCLDMNKLIEEIKNLCANIGVAGIDDEPFTLSLHGRTMTKMAIGVYWHQSVA